MKDDDVMDTTGIRWAHFSVSVEAEPPCSEEVRWDHHIVHGHETRCVTCYGHRTTDDARAFAHEIQRACDAFDAELRRIGVPLFEEWKPYVVACAILKAADECDAHEFDE